MKSGQAILQKFFTRFIYNPSYRAVSFTNSSWQQFMNFFGYSSTDAEEDVTVSRASRIDTVFSCLNVLAQDISRLPMSVRQKTDKGRIVKNTDPNHYLLRTRPNRYTSAVNFWYKVVFYMMSEGNAYAIKNDMNGQRELFLPHPSRVESVLVEGELFYRIDGKVILSQEEVLHFKLYTIDDSVVGVSPLIWCANTIGYRLKHDKYKAKVLGAKPEGLLSFDKDLNAEQTKQAQTLWKEMTSKENLGGTPALGGGAKYTPFRLNPDESQMIESGNMSDEQIMQIYRIPPTVIQRYKDSAFKGPEQQDLVYLKYALSPILKVIEQECDYKLFRESNKTAKTPLYTKFNIKEMLRGSLKEQGEWYKLLVSYGLATLNEIREMEDMPPYLGEYGDVPVIQGAYVPLNLLQDFYKDKSASGGGSERQLGFDIQYIKEALQRTEIMNSHE